MAFTNNRRVRDIGQNITVNDHNFKGAKELSGYDYANNNNSTKIKRRIMLCAILAFQNTLQESQMYI